MRVRPRALPLTAGDVRKVGDTFTAPPGYAAGHRLARPSSRSPDRDRERTGTTGRVGERRGGVSRRPYDFARVIARYAG